MQIAMITCKRDPSYVTRSVDSFFATSNGRHRLLLYPDGNIDEALKLASTYAPAIVVEAQSSAELALAASSSRRERAVQNFSRALSAGDESILLLEDDIVFKPGWAELFDDMSASVNLYSLYTHPKVAEYVRAQHSLVESGWVPVPANYFYGTLALFVPRGERHWLAREIAAMASGRRGLIVPFDTAVAAYAFARNIAIRTSIPGYVDHIGEVSSIPENSDKGSRKSPLF